MELQEEGNITRCAISRRTIFDIWHSKQGTENEKSQHVLDTLTEMAPLSQNIENIDMKILSIKLRNLCKRFSCYWKKTYCSQIKLIEKYGDWLAVMEYIDVIQSVEPRILQQNDNVDSLPSCSRGRPKKDFNDCSKRSKRRRLAEISNLDTSAVNTLLNTSADANSSSTKIDECEVLSLIAEAKLTRHQMPASVHKILIHGADIINHSLLSIGELSEEAAEATNKYIKEYRRDHTRKMNRVLTNTDLINRLLLHSDPLISGLRKLPKKK